MVAVIVPPGFLHAISEAPDDDTPRLVYADWLADRDSPHAALVRLTAGLRWLCVQTDWVPDIEYRLARPVPAGCHVGFYLARVRRYRRPGDEWSWEAGLWTRTDCFGREPSRLTAQAAAWHALLSCRLASGDCVCRHVEMIARELAKPVEAAP